MLDWYQVALSAEVVHSDGMLAFLTYDQEHHRIAIAAIPGLEDQPPMAAGTDHIAFTYADLGDLLYTYLRLKRRGIEPYWCIQSRAGAPMHLRAAAGPGGDVAAPSGIGAPCARAQAGYSSNCICSAAALRRSS